MSDPTRLRELLAGTRVLPILTVAAPETAVRIAGALREGGVRVLELTLRTAQAEEAIAAVRSAWPDLVVGAGTLLRPEDFARAEKAGAQFAVSPGLDEPLARASRLSPLPLMPGVQTASEVMRAIGHGFDTLKFYPAKAAGGPDVLADFATIFPEAVFVPTGKVGRADVAAYLGLPNVLCVGGSWVAPREAVSREDWATVSALARQASGLTS